MQEIIIDVLNNFGYLGIAALIAIENLFPPIPSEVILALGGFMTTYTKLNVIGIIIASTIGSVVGACILYYIGRVFNVGMLKRIVEGKIGKILRLKTDDIDNASKWFDKKGGLTVFFCRFIPIIRSLISIPAGMNKMAFGYFLLLTTIGTVIWNTVLVILGSIFGQNWDLIADIFDKYSNLVLILGIIFVIVFIIWFYNVRIKKKKK